MNLIIVESPNKIKTIAKIVGPKYKVIATRGHFRDLDAKDLSVNMITYDPIYKITKHDVIKQMKKMSIGKTIYLATDDDREGEAISQHILDVLKPKKYHRILFNEISKKAITKSLSNPTVVNDNLVASQTARRVIDRLYGWIVSPMLMNHFKQTLSAGRVQSVATRLVVDKEKSVIESYEKGASDLFTVTAIIDDMTWQLYKENQVKDLSYDEALRFVKNSSVSTLSVKSIKYKSKAESPPPPYDTLAIQRDAKTPPKETMRQLQQLYEQGLITYIRTKSHHLAEECHDMCKKYLGSQYVKRTWPSDGGHEAIRPTCIKRVEGTALYQMIWKRTVASVMPEAIIRTMTIQLDISKYKPYAKRRYWQTQLKCVEEPGYLSLYGIEPGTIEYEPKMNLTKITAIQSFSVKERFTSSTFLSKLKKLGIGSPSTYASIIDTILSREYVQIADVDGFECSLRQITLTDCITVTKKKTKVGASKKRLIPTKLGTKVTEFLPLDLISYDLTSQMEKKLDSIAEGKLDWRKVVKEYHTLIKEHVPKHQIINGKYGPYIRVNGKNISIPKGLKDNDITQELINSLVKR